MATFGPPLRDNATNFNDQYTNPGLRNPERAESGQDEKRQPADRRRKRQAPRQYQGRQEQNEYDEELSPQNQRVQNRYYNPNTYPAPGISANKNSIPPSKTKVKASLFARARGISFGIVAISTLLPFYFFWQIPFAILGIIFLGMSLQVENSYILSGIDFVAQYAGSWFGYEYTDLAGFGMLAVGTAGIFGVISCCILGFTAILWGLHPLSGNAAGSKKAAFIVGIVGAFIPFVNIFPWIIFWILIMMRYPK